MAPTNRLIEARRAELRAEADKKQEDKTATNASRPKSPGGQTKPRPTPKS